MKYVREMMKNMKDDLEKMQTKQSLFDDSKAGAFFDAIFKNEDGIQSNTIST